MSNPVRIDKAPDETFKGFQHRINDAQRAIERETGKLAGTEVISFDDAGHVVAVQVYASPFDAASGTYA